MTPIFFPHTYLSHPVMEAVQACFSPVVLYQPSARHVPPPLREWEETGQVELRVPIPAAEEKLASLLKDFRHWADLHRDKHGIDRAYFKTRRNGLPFFDETSGAWILADLKARRRHENPAVEAHLLTARLLLCIAQEMDVHNDSLTMDLQRTDAMEQMLFRQLSGEEAVAHLKTGALRIGLDAGTDYMLKERIAAWAALAAADAAQRGPDASGIFVTTSRSVVEHVTEPSPAAVKVFEAAGVPLKGGRSKVMQTWRRELLEQLITLVHAEKAAAAADTLSWPAVPFVADPGGRATLRVFLFPGQLPGSLLRGALFPADDRGREDAAAARLNSTVVAWVD